MSDTNTPAPGHKGPNDEDRDEALDDTFPASDPISIGGSTGPDDGQKPNTLEENASEGNPS